jgi:hypothetical protein
LNALANCLCVGLMVDLKIGRSFEVYKFLHFYKGFEATIVSKSCMFERENRVEKKLTKWSKTTYYYRKHRNYPRTLEYQALWLLPLRDLSGAMN